MKRTLCGLILLCSVASCSKETSDAGKAGIPSADSLIEYVIPKGAHDARGNGIRLLSTKSLKFIARFDSSCIYSNVNPANARDINKLYGFSDCGSHHHQNSARVGWVWNGREMELYAYCYVNDERTSKLLGIAPVGKEIEMGISVAPGMYIFSLNGERDTMPRGCNGEVAEGYRLYPYFGGDEVAPHEMRIGIREM